MHIHFGAWVIKKWIEKRFFRCNTVLLLKLHQSKKVGWSKTTKPILLLLLLSFIPFLFLSVRVFLLLLLLLLVSLLLILILLLFKPISFSFYFLFFLFPSRRPSKTKSKTDYNTKAGMQQRKRNRCQKTKQKETETNYLTKKQGTFLREEPRHTRRFSGTRSLCITRTTPTTSNRTATTVGMAQFCNRNAIFRLGMTSFHLDAEWDLDAES